jgi:hypothetical protein
MYPSSLIEELQRRAKELLAFFVRAAVDCKFGYPDWFLLSCCQNGRRVGDGVKESYLNVVIKLLDIPLEIVDDAG